MADIRITCNDGGLHEDRGLTNIIHLRKLPAPGLDGASWREVPVKSNKTNNNEYESARVLGAERGTRETVITPDGERLTGVSAGRTRSRIAAEAAGCDPDTLIGSTLHFDLRCSTCGLHPSLSSPNLDRILDGLHGAGHTQVTLKVIETAVHRLQR